LKQEVPQAMAALLPPPRPASRPFPWRVLLVFALPAAALAAGTGLQRWLEGPLATGDASLRWLELSCGAGVALGLVTGLARRQKTAWILYGAAAPWVVAGLVTVAVHAARPVREMLADRREAACRAEGRPVCTVREFRAHCEKGEATALGTPRSKTCGASDCTSRWLYAGPFRPNNYVAPGSILCSIVSSPNGQLARASLMPSDEVE
jgi:hypothetical protein